MKRSISIIIGSLLLFTLYPSTLAADSFSDIHNHPYNEAIEYLHGRGVVQGYENLTFRPDSAINRAEMLKIILTATETDDAIGDARECFSDVRIDWFARFVCFAKTKGIVKGYADGRFKPSQEVNMVEGLKMALESFDVTLPKAGTLWYTPYVEFAHDNNIFSKYAYFPNRSMTRGEMAYLIYKLMLDDQGTKKFTGERSNLSAGCGVNPPSSPPSSSLISNVTREYITVIPKDYNKDKPKKLIFAFHGRTNPNTQVRGYYKVEQAAGNEAIMIYPAGLPAGSGSRNWSNSGDSANNLRDFTLFDQLLNEFGQKYCVDLDEVYVVGHSLGAWFTNSLGCARGNVIRGIGSLGGGITAGNCTGPVATWISHNPKDNLAPYSSGVAARDTFLRNNVCGTGTTGTSPSSLKCVSYQGCLTDAPVTWCPHTVDTDNRGVYYPHTWPKETGQAIWDFFKSL